MLGNDIVLKKGSVAAGTAIAAGRTTRFELNSETVDITSQDEANRWRKLLAGGGVKTMSISFSGVLKDVATHDQMIDDQIAQTIDTYGLVIDTLGSFEGPFQLTTFSASGEHNGEIQFDVTLESGGDITYAAIS